LQKNRLFPYHVPIPKQKRASSVILFLLKQKKYTAIMEEQEKQILRIPETPVDNVPSKSSSNSESDDKQVKIQSIPPIVKVVNNVKFPVVGAEDKIDEVIKINDAGSCNIAGMSKTVYRDCNGRTMLQIKAEAEAAEKGMSTDGKGVMMVYLGLLSKVKAEEIAQGQMRMVSIGLSKDVECPTVSLGPSDSFSTLYPGVNGMVVNEDIPLIQKYIRYKLRQMFKNQPTDIYIMKRNPFWMDWGTSYIWVYVVNTTFVPNRYFIKDNETK
jgi:hypothetical protein